MRAGIRAVLVGLVVWYVAGAGDAGAAAGRKRTAAEEEAYAKPLAAVDPALVTLFHQATAALDADRYEEARAAFEKILARAPDHAPSLRRLSYAVGAGGDIERGLELARKARAAAPGRDGDLAVASALFADRANPAAQKEAGAILDDLLGGTPDEGIATMAAVLAARRNDLPGLGRAVEALERAAPAGKETNVMGAIYYASRGDLDKAEAAIQRAEAAGMSKKDADQLREDSGIARRHTFWYAARAALWGLGLWALGLALIFVAGKLMSAAALRAVERHAADRGDALLTAARALRRAYALAIGIAAVYYYLSIPVVIAIVIAGVGGVLYGIVMLGWIPIKLVLLLLIGGGLTIWALARSLFARRGKDQDPGRRLPEAEAPALWAVVRQVAAEVGTRPVDDVFLTPGTEVAVTERGSMAVRLRDRGQRHLILGVGVLDGMSARQLRAVMAHEYGHFSNRDTAGGDVASRVRASLLGAVIRMAQGGGASALNPAWHFLRLFFALFQRITLGASRLQEVLADRFSAAIYGGAVFADGLRHVVRRGVQFGAQADAAIHLAQAQQRAIANLYVPDEGAVDPQNVEAEIAKALNDPGSPYDSHPPVERRIAWVAAFPTPLAAPADAPAWSLFPDRARLEAEMTTVINHRLGAA